MKIYLASFFQSENHGPGRLIGISSGKPPDIECRSFFKDFIPYPSIHWEYKRIAKYAAEKAQKYFEKEYKKQLDLFMSDLAYDAKAMNKDPLEMLPFEDGDTLASWELEGHLTYRNILGPYLEKVGYEISLK